MLTPVVTWQPGVTTPEEISASIPVGFNYVIEGRILTIFLVGGQQLTLAPGQSFQFDVEVTDPDGGDGNDPG